MCHTTPRTLCSAPRYHLSSNGGTPFEVLCCVCHWLPVAVVLGKFICYDVTKYVSMQVRGSDRCHVTSGLGTDAWSNSNFKPSKYWHCRNLNSSIHPFIFASHINVASTQKRGSRCLYSARSTDQRRLLILVSGY
jgi:hypothetical protein